MNNLVARIGLVGLCWLGCGTGEGVADVPPVNEKVELQRASSSEEALLVQPTLIWPQSTLRVCFRTPTITTAERNVVRNAAHQWEKATGLRFTGFGNCTVPVTNAEIGIIQDEVLFPHGTGGPPYGAISLRFSYINQPSCATSAAIRERCLMTTAIHEIGHVLGFAHEQLRTDDDGLLGLSTCSQQVADGTWGVPEYFGRWDLYSIMNYCNPNGAFDGDFAVLSETDQNGAAWNYGRPNDFADLNGDGKADAIVVNGESISARFSDGTTFGPNVTISSFPYYGRNGTRFADVDGDLDADAIVVGDLEIVVRKSNGNSLGPNEQWSSSAFLGRHGTFFADVTGDGRADAIAVSEDQVLVRRSLFPNANAFGPAEVWLTNAAFPLDSTFSLNGSPWSHIPFSFQIRIANVTSGDNRADLVLFTQSGVRVFPSTGINFEVSPSTFWAPMFFGNRTTDVADMNGDGRKDIIVSNQAGLASASGVHVRYSNGTSSFNIQHMITDNEYWGERGMFFANVDGYAGDEAIVVNDNGIVVRRMAGGTLGPNELWSGPFFSISR